MRNIDKEFLEDSYHNMMPPQKRFNFARQVVLKVKERKEWLVKCCGNDSKQNRSLVLSENKQLDNLDYSIFEVSMVVIPWFCHLYHFLSTNMIF